MAAKEPGERAYAALATLYDGEWRTLTEVWDRIPNVLHSDRSSMWFALRRLLADGLIVQVKDRPDYTRDGPWFQITTEGRQVAERRRALWTYLATLVDTSKIKTSSSRHTVTSAKQP